MTDVNYDFPQSTSVKDMAVHLISRMPDQVTGDDIMYEIYVRQKIEEGLEAARESRVLSHDEVKKRFGII